MKFIGGPKNHPIKVDQVTENIVETVKPAKKSESVLRFPIIVKDIAITLEVLLIRTALLTDTKNPIMPNTTRSTTLVIAIVKVKNVKTTSLGIRKTYRTKTRAESTLIFAQSRSPLPITYKER